MSKITTFLSHWLEVATCRDGKQEHIRFVEGEYEKRSVNMDASNTPTGTVVSWQPSEEFFTHTEVEINKITDLLKTITCLCPGLTIVLNNNSVETKFYSEKGLDDLIDNSVKDKEILDKRFHTQFKDGKNAIDFILTYTSSYSSTIVPYVNTGLTERGPHITLIKTFITKELNRFFREQKWIKEKEENLTGDDIQEGCYIVFNITAPNVSYDAQVKSTVTKIDMKPFLGVLAEDLRNWLENNKADIKVIADKALNARKAREAAKKAKDAVRNKEEKKKKALKFDSKLADCYSKDRARCEIYITEGKR